MSFSFDPPRSLLIVAAVVAVLLMFGLSLGRRRPVRKALNLIFGVALVAILISRYQKHQVLVDDSGISADTYGAPRIAWEDVTDTRLIETLAHSKYRPRPSLKTAFRQSGYGQAYYGSFDLNNGDHALVAVQQADGPAVLVVTADANYLLAPAEVMAFAESIAAYRPVAGLDAGKP